MSTLANYQSCPLGSLHTYLILRTCSITNSLTWVENNPNKSQHKNLAFLKEINQLDQGLLALVRQSLIEIEILYNFNIWHPAWKNCFMCGRNIYIRLECQCVTWMKFWTSHTCKGLLRLLPIWCRQLVAFSSNLFSCLFSSSFWHPIFVFAAVNTNFLLL